MKTFSVLAMLMPQDKLEQHLSSIIDQIVRSASEKNNDLLQNSLAIMKTAFRNTDPQKTSFTAQKEAVRIARFLNEAL